MRAPSSPDRVPLLVQQVLQSRAALTTAALGSSATPATYQVMGMRARQRAREESAPRQSRATPAVHVTVAAIADGSTLDLSHETRLVKSALLYADHVTLASPKALLMASIAGFGAGDRRARMDATAELMSVMENGQEGAQLYQQLSRRRRLSPQERRMLRGLEQILDASSAELIEKIDEILDSAGAGDISQAMSAGLADIHALGQDEADADSYLDDVIEQMTALLGNSVAASAQTFPLFDDDAGNMLRLMVKEGIVTDPHAARAAEAGIAGRLIGGLEAFPDADMDVILDVRTRLQAPLVRFRSALAQTSTEFATAAWDESFAREVDDLYRRKVAPALLEVEEALRDLGVRSTLLRLSSSKEAVATAAATIGLAAAGDLTHADLPALLYGAPAIAATVAGAAEALQRRPIRRAAERNAFYFLYQGNRELGG
jgi:hypothetical protein